MREPGVFTKIQALTLDAESNILDEKGAVKDYANYFRLRPEVTLSDALDRGLLSRARGDTGWQLGRNATGDFFVFYADDQIAEGKAVAIARGAPGDAPAQASAMRRAKPLSPEELGAYARNLARIAPGADADPGAQNRLLWHNDRLR